MSGDDRRDDRRAGRGPSPDDDRRRSRRAYREHRHRNPWGPDGPWGPEGPWGPSGPWGRHGPRPRPSWWPHDEPWPPTGDFPWRKVRRRFFLRFAIGVTLVSVLVLTAPVFVVSQLLSVGGVRDTAAQVMAVAIVIAVVLAISGTARSARRFAVPFGGLIEAAGKVEAGDYSARVNVPDRGLREMRWLADAFNSMAARLETDERQRRTLLADVSHELRTPLAILRGELEAMIDGVHPIDEAHLASAVDQIAMLTRLVEDLRTLALAEAGTLALHPESTDLSVLAGESAASFESLAAETLVRVTVHMPDEMPLVDLDPVRIQQVIGNLVANALRYAPAGSEVSIEGSVPRPGVVAISVVDHGPGIDPDVLPQLFERFAKSEESRGSGLGLAIARRLVEAHGGSIKAECPPGGGTIVTFELPAGPQTNK